MRAIVLSSAILPFMATATAVSFDDRPPVTVIEALDSVGGDAPSHESASDRPSGAQAERQLLPLNGADVLWDNGISYLNGLSNRMDPRRSILDDFVVDGAGWSIVGWHARFGRNCGIIGCSPSPWQYTFYADDDGAPDPDKIVAVAQNTFTLSVFDPDSPDFFGVDVHDVWSDFDPIELPPGTYWVEMWNVSEDAGSFQIISDTVNGSPAWVDYSDFGGLQPGIEVFGEDYNVNFLLVGNALSQSAVLPSDFEVIFGAYQSGDVESLHDSDDEYLIVEQRSPVSVILPRIRLEVEGISQFETPSSVTVTVEASVNSLPTRPPQRLSMFNDVIGMWEQIDERTATLNDSVVEVTIDTDAARFIEGGTRTIRLRADWFNPTLVFSPAWGAQVDQVVWAVTE